MRKILVVGAGQAGLQLALDLLRRGYDVTVVSDRTPDGIAAGKVMSSQCMFGAALQTERRLGIDLRSGICPTVDGIQLTVPGPDGSKALHWAARLDAPAQSVDQRVKIPRWMRMLEQRGGKLLIHDASAEDLQTFLPWEAERARGAALTDDNGVLTGRFAPTVRKPAGMLPSGRHAACVFFRPRVEQRGGCLLAEPSFGVVP